MQSICAFICFLSIVAATTYSIKYGNSDMLIGMIIGAIVFGISSPIILFWKD